MSRAGRLGVAIPAALFVLALVTALAISGAFVSRQFASASRISERSGVLEAAAERAAVHAVAGWDSLERAAQPIGAAAPIAVAPGRTPVEVWITRIGPRTYWIVAEASTEVRPSLRRRIGLVVRVASGVPAPVPERAWFELF